MSQALKRVVLLGSGDPTLLKLLGMILTPDSYTTVVAKSGAEVRSLAVSQRPHMLVLDDALAGANVLELCRAIRQNPVTRYQAILVLSSQTDVDGKIAAFEAGADEFVAKPFDPKELTYRIKNLVARVRVPAPTEAAPSKHGRLIAVFGTKGGVGKTTVAVNLALALQRQTGGRVLIMDADFSFGDVGVHLNLPPTHSIMDLVGSTDDLEPELVDQVVVRHSSAIRVLLSPFSPEKADLITPDHVKRILTALVEQNDYVVVDCHATYDERMLSILDRADEIMLVVTPEVGPLKNTRMFLDIADKLGLTLDKVHLILNRANSNVGIEAQEIERSFKRRVEYRIASGGRPVVLSVNQGQPLMTGKLDNPVAQEILKISDWIVKN
ncbi:MAG: response regulator [Chloroflexi bacterium]|nr:response regulator [Chloroflexota bacterium]